MSICRLFVVLALSVSLPSAGAAMQSLSVHACTESRTCAADGTCVKAGTRLVIAEVREPGDVLPYFSMGPMVVEASGGLFYARGWRWVLGGVPLASEEIGRAYLLSTADGLGMKAHVYRAGREVANLDADWVRADYDCKQVIF